MCDEVVLEHLPLPTPCFNYFTTITFNEVLERVTPVAIRLYQPLSITFESAQLMITHNYNNYLHQQYTIKI